MWIDNDLFYAITHAKQRGTIKELEIETNCSAKCTHCAHQIKDLEAFFCAHCGTPLFRDGCCRECGKQLQKNANYCDRCGTPTKLSSSEYPPVYQTPHLASPAEKSSGSHPEIEKEEKLRSLIDSEVLRRVTEAQVDRTAERSIQKEKARQAEMLKYGIRESDWVVICEGSFLMGSPTDEKDRFTNERQHEVQVSSFEMLKTPVTFDMYDTFCSELRQMNPSDETWGRDNRPVINITYWDAQEYCRWLSKRTQSGIRLPTEAEWELACRAGTTTPFSTGATITTEQANYDGNFTYDGSGKGTALGKTSPVDTFPPNPWGLYDMHGNVWEWCASAYDEAYSGAELENAGYNSDDLRERIVRGGSWHNVPGGLRSASRNKLMPTYHYLRVGFRVVREIE